MLRDEVSKIVDLVDQLSKIIGDHTEMIGILNQRIVALEKHAAMLKQK